MIHLPRTIAEAAAIEVKAARDAGLYKVTWHSYRDDGRANQQGYGRDRTNFAKIRYLRGLAEIGEGTVAEISTTLHLNKKGVRQFLHKLYEEDYVAIRRVLGLMYFRITEKGLDYLRGLDEDT